MRLSSSKWGWEFWSVLPPHVAQRVWPMPIYEFLCLVGITSLSVSMQSIFLTVSEASLVRVKSLSCSLMEAIPAES